jgi:hypothetical protein
LIASLDQTISLAGDDVNYVHFFIFLQVLDRGEKIELLVDKTENLRSQADNFQRQGKQLRRKMWFQNFKVKLIVLAIIIVVILIIYLSICHGFICHSGRSNGT